MDTQHNASQASDNIKKDNNALIELGWPLAITMCGTIIAFGILGNVLIWWIKTRTFCNSSSATTPGSHELESQSVHGKPLLHGIRPTLDRKVLVKKRHLLSRATLSNFTWESTSDCATMRSFPTLPVLPKYNTFQPGRASTTTSGAELASSRRSGKRRSSSAKSGRGLPLRRRSTRRPPLPDHEFRNLWATNPTIQRARSCSHEPKAPTKQNSVLPRVQRYSLRGHPKDGEDITESASVTPTISMGNMPHYSKPISLQMESQSPPRDTDQYSEVSYGYAIPWSPKTGVQNVHNRCDTAASVSDAESSCFDILPTEPPQILRKGFLPWSPERMSIDPADNSAHMGTLMGSSRVANHSRPANQVRPVVVNVSTAPEDIREQLLNSTVPNYMDHRERARSGVSDPNSPSQGHQRHQPALSSASSTSTAGSAAYSATISQYEPFYLQNLLAQPIATPPPRQYHGAATPIVNWNAWQQLDKQRPLSRAKTAS